MIPDRISETEPADLPVADAAPLADVYAASTSELQREVIALRAKVAQLETPQREWMVLKKAARQERIRYETLRKWCARGAVVAQRDSGRILVDAVSLRQYLGRSRDL